MSVEEDESYSTTTVHVCSPLRSGFDSCNLQLSDDKNVQFYSADFSLSIIKVQSKVIGLLARTV
jgi:predicted  nucleic acid-binding Zn ribbon protein